MRCHYLCRRGSWQPSLVIFGRHAYQALLERRPKALGAALRQQNRPLSHAQATP
jgi:hypothetical protein